MNQACSNVIVLKGINNMRGGRVREQGKRQAEEEKDREGGREGKTGSRERRGKAGREGE